MRGISYRLYIAGLLMLALIVAACSRTKSTPAPVGQAEGQGPTVEIGSAALGPDRTMSICPGQTVALTTRATGQNLSYAWSVDGGGHLQRQGGRGDEGSSNRYTAPITWGEEEVVKVTVTDDLNQSGTDQLVIQVVECPTPTPTDTTMPDTPTPTNTPTPTPTNTPAPTQTSTRPPSPEPTCELVSLRPPVDGSEINDLEVKITSPEDCSMGLPLGKPIPSAGSYSGSLEGREIWILVYASDLKYYPQSPGACQMLPAQASGGKWATTLFFATAAEQLDIVATVTDANSEATRVFKDWLKTGCETGEYPGFPILPNGLTELDAITVRTAGPSEESPPPSTTEATGCRSFRPPLKGAATFAGEVDIANPSTCATDLPAESSIPVSGTYQGIPENVDIWVLVYPPNLVYYPQSPNACEGLKMPFGGGAWQVPAYLGTEDGNPESFDIVVILADQDASQFLSDWVKEGCQTNNYKGIPAAQLEQKNITEKSFITVQTWD